MPCCSAVGCKNRSEKGFRLFRFPADPERKKIWMAKIRRDAWKPTSYSMLCEVHFGAEQFENKRADGRKLLKPFAIPEIFPHRPVKTPRKPPTKREVSSLIIDNESSLDLNMDEPVSPTATIEATATAEATSLGQVEETEEDKDEKIKRLESKVLSLQRKVRTLEQQLERTTKALNDFLNPDQILVLGKKSAKGHKWSNVTLKNALQLRFACGIKGYNCILKLNYPLPSDRTLSRRLEGFKFCPGVQEEIFEFLRIKVDLMNEKERMCVLLMDETAIEERVELDRSSKTLFGYTTLPPSEAVATHALVFMLAGVSTRWKQTVAYHYTGNSFNSVDVKDIIVNIIEKCYGIGLLVTCVTCDMGSCNRAVWREFGVTCGKYSVTSNTFPHPSKTGSKVYIMADVCRILKNLRNHLLDGKYIYINEDDVRENGLPTGRVSLDPVRKLIDLQANRELKIVPKLTQGHVEVRQYQKMRVRTARELMSHDVAAGIRYGVDHLGWTHEFLTTAWFFEQVEKWFELMCSRNTVMAISKLRIDVYEESIDFLKKFVEICERMSVGDGKWKPVQTGIKLTTETVLQLQHYLLNDCSFHYVLTSRFCQDSLENLFSCVRVKNPIPSPVQFKNALKIISIGQFMLVPSKGNCDPDEGAQLADFLEVSGTRVEEVQEEETLPNFEGTISSLDAVDQGSLFYLSGFVVKQVCKLVQCDTCINLLCGDGSDVGASGTSLLALKEKKEGALVRPSKWCFELSKEAEGTFERCKAFLGTLKCNVVDFLCKKMDVVAPELVQCHDVRALFLQKFFCLRAEIYVKALTEKYKKSARPQGHGSRSVYMRKVVK